MKTQREMMRTHTCGHKYVWTNVCRLNKQVFKNKRISVFKHKPYTIEVLVLCYVMGLTQHCPQVRLYL